MANPNQTITAYDFQLEICELSPSKRPDLVIDIRNLVLEINIFEHIEKSYLTGNIIMSDTSGLYPHLDLKGVDRLKIGVKLPDADADTIERTFYIDSVINSTRTNDNEYVYTLHLVEEIAYLSDFIMVNQAFEGGDGRFGSGTEILLNLFQNYFNRDIIITGDTGDGRRRYEESTPPLRYIAPNISPLAVAAAIRSRMVDVLNSPYFLYASLAGENTHLQSFMDMLDFNREYSRPFKFSQANTAGIRSSDSNVNVAPIETQQYNIESYTDNSTLDLRKINDKGYVNSMFYFYDVNRGLPYNPSWMDPTITNRSITSTLRGNHWTAFGMFNNDPRADEAIKYLYPKTGMLPWTTESGNTEAAFNQGDVQETINNPEGGNAFLEAIHRRPPARNVINLFSSSGFNDDTSSYNENPNDGSVTAQSRYLDLVDARALAEWMKSDPIQLVMPGRIFLGRPANQPRGLERPTSIGRVANLQFTTLEGSEVVPDLKKSGKHLLYAARHLFSLTEGYKVHFSAVKIEPESNTERASEQGTSSPPYFPDAAGGDARV